MPKVPRDTSGRKLCELLGKYGYRITKQTGGHIRLTSSFMGHKHSISIPDHSPVKIGTMNKILHNIAGYLEMQKNELLDDLVK